MFSVFSDLHSKQYERTRNLDGFIFINAKIILSIKTKYNSQSDKCVRKQNIPALDEWLITDVTGMPV